MRILIAILIITFATCTVSFADVSRWQKLNQLVPNPKCSMREDSQGVLRVTEWKDARSQPSDPVIDAVTEQEVIAIESATMKEKKFNKDIIKAIGLTMKDFMNEIMAGRTNPITNSELKTKFKSYLP